jgi:hypothetical protein
MLSTKLEQNMNINAKADWHAHWPTRNGAVASAVSLVHLAWTGPFRLALAGATRSGTAGVGQLLAIRG